MSYNGSGTFQINTSGQPVVAGTVISSTAFNALTADLATGLSTAITKDGQTTTTARIPFAAGINSSLTTDSTNSTSGSIITAGGVGVAKAVFIGTTLNVTGVATFSAAPIYSSLTASSAVATDASKALVSVTNTGTGNNVLATSPTLVTPILGTPASGSLVNCTDINYTGFKNRIINGAMVIDQRNAGASGTAGSGVVYILDRWFINGSQASKLNYQQNAGGVTPPAGFKNYLGVNVGATATIGASDYFFIGQRIEGFNVADLGFGAAGASTVNLSFKVYSSATGTFSGALINGANNRAYPFNYTVSSANTWTTATVSIAGDTSGTWSSDNTSGMEVRFNLGAGSSFLASAGAWGASNAAGATGSVSIMGTSSATFYITGVQLEKGSTATSFDYRPYGTEFMLCQRYYAKQLSIGTFTNFGIGTSISATNASMWLKFNVTMRSAPTIAVSSMGLSDGTNLFVITSLSTGYIGTDSALLQPVVSSGLVQFRPVQLQANNNASAFVEYSSEL